MSTGRIIIDEVTGEKRRLRQSFEDGPIDTTKFDGLIFTSGNMKDSEAYWTHKQARRYVDEFNQQGKPIAAICITVPVLIPAVAGKQVTCFPLIREKDMLRRAGAILSPVSVVRDQNLVTAENQMATQMWAEEYCRLLEGKPSETDLQDCNWKVKTIPRRPIAAIERIRQTAVG
jgi:protease I